MFRVSRIDRSFRRFLHTGDAKALGSVFDAAAPELFKIAAYLTGERQMAEDLVQSTFLIVLERRAEFDPSRSVMAWLCGIVANLARAERRRRRPTTAAAVPIEYRASVVHGDPVVSAELAEFRTAFVRARESLSAPYRPVLELHLEHGLPASDIARLLERPAGTVRAQITRGLEQLRKRLPNSFVAGVLGVVALPAMLCAMRTSVLRRAATMPVQPSLAASAGIEAWIGIGIMKKKVFVAIVAVALLALGVWSSRALSPDSPLRPSPTNASPVVRAEQVVDPSADGLSAQPVAAERSAAAIVAAAEAAADTGRIEVTARWQSDGAPAVRQAIEVICAGDPLAQLRPRRACTDAAGHCVLEQVPIGAVMVFTSTGLSQEVVVEAQATTQVSIDLPFWGIVRGVVVDPFDNPVPDADVWVSSELRYAPPARGGIPGRGQHGSFTLRADVNGRFETRLGRIQSIAAVKVGFGPSALLYPCSGEAPSAGIEVRLQLTAEGSTLVVEVRDGDGMPIGDAHVMVGEEVPTLVDQSMTRATAPPRRGNTDRLGVVELAPLPTGTLPIQVRAAGFSPWQGDVELLPSQASRTLVRLQPAARVRGVVVDRSGAPIADAFVAQGRLSELRSSVAKTDASGRFALDSLPSGSVELTAWKDGCGTSSIELQLEPGAARDWSPVLSMRPAITGVVLGLDRQPAAGAYVVCLASQPGRSHSLSATADARGRFVLGPLLAGRSYSVTSEVVDAVHGASRVSQSGVTPESEIVLQILPGAVRTAALCGRLLEADGTPATRVQLTVTPTDAGIGYFVNVEADGRFATGPAVPGRVRLEVWRQGVVIADLGEHELPGTLKVDLGDVTLPTPGRLELRVLGDAIERGVVSLFAHGRYFGGRRLEAQELQWDMLPPGDYEVCVQSGGQVPRLGATRVTIPAASTVRAELRVQAAHRCRLRLSGDLSGDGSTVLKVEDDGGHTLLRSALGPAGDDGSTPVLLPAGNLRLSVRAPDGAVGETRVTIPTEVPIAIRLSR